MNTKHISGNQLKSQVRAAVNKHIDLSNYQLFFFGSRVSGNNMERSDIDLGIKGSKPLNLKTKFAIINELEKIPTLYKFDFVDFGKTTKVFKEDAMKHTDLIQ